MSFVTEANTMWEHSPGEMYLSIYKGIYALSANTFEAKPVTLPGAPDTITILYHFIDSGGNEWLCSRLVYIKKLPELNFLKGMT